MPTAIPRSKDMEIQGQYTDNSFVNWDNLLNACSEKIDILHLEHYPTIFCSPGQRREECDIPLSFSSNCIISFLEMIHPQFHI